MNNILNAMRGISGEFEVNRVVGALGTIAYIVGANAFVAWNMWSGEKFDVTAYCLAFPAGLGVAVGSIAGAVGWKDQKVASAKVTEQTGAVPVAAPAGPQVPMGDPPPVGEPK